MALGIGIIGTGGISRAHVAGYAALGERVSLQAVADIDADRVQAAAADLETGNVQSVSKNVSTNKMTSLFSVTS